MPITGPGSYVQTLNEFIGHWGDVNIALGAAGPLVLQDSTTISILTGYRDQLQTFAASIQSLINDLQISGADVAAKESQLRTWLGEFNRKVRGSIPKSPYAGALPEAPSGSAAAATMLEAFDDMASLWAKINAATIPGFTPPLLLPGGTPVATVSAAVVALRTAYASERNADKDLDLERRKRDAVQVKAYNAMRDYRDAVAGVFPANDPHVLSLPKLTPDPGATPDAVSANGSWITALLKAKIECSESTDPNLLQYELRMCAGANYSTDNEVVVGNIPAGGTREFLTDAGLPASGAVATFKVYVILTTGNEKGSNTVLITRP